MKKAINIRLEESLLHDLDSYAHEIDRTRTYIIEKAVGKDLEKGVFTNDRPLKGKHQGKFRKKCGNYRIVYFKENDVLLITVIRVAHRKEVY